MRWIAKVAGPTSSLTTPTATSATASSKLPVSWVAGLGGTFEAPLWAPRKGVRETFRTREAYFDSIADHPYRETLALKHRASVASADFDALLEQAPADVLFCHEGAVFPIPTVSLTWISWPNCCRSVLWFMAITMRARLAAYPAEFPCAASGEPRHGGSSFRRTPPEARAATRADQHRRDGRWSSPPLGWERLAEAAGLLRPFNHLRFGSEA